ncbi:MAG: tRNA pseudouridine(13) synthase TruD, partial [Nitrospira sp.]|nr:tRNA pseudouridine(13) synthase TruD [Nitrospira sp.]
TFAARQTITMSHAIDPYLTSEIPGIGGRIRVTPEDFRVEELPLYLPCGTGEHLYIKVTKRLLSTPDLIKLISNTTGLKAKAIGTAGLKDARAVTTQMLSLHLATPDQVARLKTNEHLLSIEILGRHRNRLRAGHHAGNRFRLVIRDVAAHAASSIPEILRLLSQRGVPNYFGPQRQGREGKNYRIGAALLNDATRRSSMSRAKRLWYLNAFQAHLFNRILARRIDSLDRVLPGDWAVKVSTGACFQVEDAAKEQTRAARFEISPTGILFGSRASWADGEPGRIEEAAVAESGMTKEILTQAAKACGFRGERRALRVPLNDLEWSLDGSVLTLGFTLSPGAYATNVLRELMKTERPQL